MRTFCEIVCPGRPVRTKYDCEAGTAAVAVTGRRPKLAPAAKADGASPSAVNAASAVTRARNASLGYGALTAASVSVLV